jgi:hypothetical protein
MIDAGDMFLFTTSMEGIRKATVLPVPVFAFARQSLPIKVDNLYI